jgi:hypothetical protein
MFRNLETTDAKELLEKLPAMDKKLVSSGAQTYLSKDAVDCIKDPKTAGKKVLKNVHEQRWMEKYGRLQAFCQTAWALHGSKTFLRRSIVGTVGPSYASRSKRRWHCVSD